MILLHDNTRMLYVATAMKQTFMELKWEVILSHLAYSPDLAPRAYLFWSMQHALEDTYFRNYGKVENWIAKWIGSKD